MPNIASTFRPPPALRNGHVQTILAALLPRRTSVFFDPERLELADGDFLDLYWVRGGGERLAILSHGLEGQADDKPMRGMAAALRRAGWDVLAWNFRGCGPEANRLPRFYHSGETGDLGKVIERAAPRYERMALVGFSLGGNLILKYLGEGKAHPAVLGGVAISAPVDLAASARALDERRENRIYLERLIGSLVRKVEAKAARFPKEIDIRGVRAIRSFQEFDDRFTAPLHGFRDAADYWQQSSARQYLAGIEVPTLLLNARNDPFLTEECFPGQEAETSKWVSLEAPDSGGHVGFLDYKKGWKYWAEERAAGFLELEE